MRRHVCLAASDPKERQLPLPAIASLRSRFIRAAPAPTFLCASELKSIRAHSRIDHGIDRGRCGFSPREPTSPHRTPSTITCTSSSRLHPSASSDLHQRRPSSPPTAENPRAALTIRRYWSYRRSSARSPKFRPWPSALCQCRNGPFQRIKSGHKLIQHMSADRRSSRRRLE